MVHNRWDSMPLLYSMDSSHENFAVEEPPHGCDVMICVK